MPSVYFCGNYSRYKEISNIEYMMVKAHCDPEELKGSHLRLLFIRYEITDFCQNFSIPVPLDVKIFCYFPPVAGDVHSQVMRGKSGVI